MGSSTATETQTTKQTIPPEVTAANAAMLARGEKLAELGYIPYMGVDVAGINPAERAAMENVGQMASAFGLAAPETSQISAPEVTMGGMTGYTSFPMYEGALERFRETRPDQYDAYAEALGYDPLTGEKKAAPAPVYSGPARAPAAAPANPMDPRIAPADAAYFSKGQYFRADGSGIGAGSRSDRGVTAFLNSQAPYRSEGSRMSTGRENRQKFGFVNTDGFIDAPYPSGGFASDMSRLGGKIGDFIEGGGLMGAIGRAMSGRN